MHKSSKYNYVPLAKPIPITVQKWPKGTVPLVHTRTMTFMHEKYIRQCIEGILMQKTTFPVQVLIHDDASTDSTREILLEYKSKFPDIIRIFLQEENSYTKLDKAERRKEFTSWRIGKYEAVCEGDDYWTDPLKLQKQIEFLEENPDFVLCSHRYRVYNESEKTFEKETKPCSTLYNGGNLVVDMEMFTKEWVIVTLTTVIRSDILRKVRTKVRRYKNSRDVHLFYLLLKEGKGVSLNNVMAVYRRHDKGAYSGKTKSEQAKLRLEAYRDLYEDNTEDYFLSQKLVSIIITDLRKYHNSSIKVKLYYYTTGLRLSGSLLDKLRLTKSLILSILQQKRI